MFTRRAFLQVAGLSGLAAASACRGEREGLTPTLSAQEMVRTGIFPPEMPIENIVTIIYNFTWKNYYDYFGVETPETRPQIILVEPNQFQTEFVRSFRGLGYPEVKPEALPTLLTDYSSIASTDRQTIYINRQAKVWEEVSGEPELINTPEALKLLPYILLRDYTTIQTALLSQTPYPFSEDLPDAKVDTHVGLSMTGFIESSKQRFVYAVFQETVGVYFAREISKRFGISPPSETEDMTFQIELLEMIIDRLKIDPKDIIAFVMENDPDGFFRFLEDHYPEEYPTEADVGKSIWTLFEVYSFAYSISETDRERDEAKTFALTELNDLLPPKKQLQPGDSQGAISRPQPKTSVRDQLGELSHIWKSSNHLDRLLRLKKSPTRPKTLAEFLYNFDTLFQNGKSPRKQTFTWKSLLRGLI